MSEKLVRPPLAFEDEQFLHSPEARSVRILSEYLKPLGVFRKHRIRDTVAFFGSARITEDGPLNEYYEGARLLANKVTSWSDALPHSTRRFVVSTGGGPGIMEAANRGATEAGGKTIGLNIRLPFEQTPNLFISPDLSLEFGYFFLRKFWFAYLAKALVVFPGGFGTMDELFEILTLVQTRKLHKEMIVILYGSAFWKEIFNFEALAKHGMISPEDLNIFQFADDPDTAFALLREGLTRLYLTPEEMAEPDVAPGIAHTRNE
ncbi:MAG: TIGR00730 family Rossman fold protein [Acidobacteria bacterium]|nr:TIGR00730 family Rossman fold protein [Acidobacteriota bacterium]